MTYEQLLALVKTLGDAYKFPNLDINAGYFPHMNLTFSSAGEDLWLRQFMKPKLRAGKPGFYVDVGAHHPSFTSTTFLFYCYGWRGICIDANSRYRDKFRDDRPRDVFANVAVSDSEVSLYFAEHKRALTMSQVRASADAFDENFFPATPVPTKTMAEIFREHVPAGTGIDFMSMDIEESELSALKSNDWSQYKPRVILIEIGGTTFNPLAPLEFPSIGFLNSHGYRYEGYSNNNVLMTGPNFNDHL